MAVGRGAVPAGPRRGAPAGPQAASTGPAPPAPSWVFRRAGRWFTLLAWQREAGAPAEAVRVGFTVGKRNARRAVDRNGIKRALREAARAARATLLAQAAAGAREVDVIVRLKAPWPRPATGAQRAELRRAVQAEAQALLLALAGVLARRHSTGAR